MSNIYGYPRVSSKGQEDNNSLEQQAQEILSKYPTAIIFAECYTGTTMDRPVFNKLLSALDTGDTLVVTKLDRLSRTTLEGIRIVTGLFRRGVSIHVLNVGLLEDTNFGRFFLTTLLAVAEMERNSIIERTQARKAVARTKGEYREGRPQKFKPEIINHAMHLLEYNSYSQVEKMTGISQSTLIRAKTKLRKKESSTNDTIEKN